jgi:peptide/nickel transport system substrate-binding protein
LRDKILACTILLIVISVLSSVSTGVRGQSPSSGVLRLAFVGPVQTFNQFTGPSDADWWLVNLEYKYGITMVPDGRLVPELFDKWWSNGDHTSWFFNIRPDAKWSDGTPVTSDDFIFTLKVGILPENDYAQIGPLIKSIEKVNATLTRIDLTAPNTIFDVNVGTAFYWIQALPEKVWSTVGNITAYSNFGTNLGDGPFYISNYQAGSTSVELLPNDFYWEGRPGLSKVEVTIVSDSSTIPLLLLAGQTDAARVDPTQVASLLSKSELGFNIEPYLSDQILTYNITNYPYTELAFRQAMAYAIDRNKLVQLAVSGYGNPGTPGLVPPDKGDWYNPDVPQYNYDPDKAKALLSQVFMTGSDGFWHLKDGSSFQPKIYADSDVATSVLAAQLIEKMLRDVGLDAKATSVTYGTMADIGASNMRTDMMVADYPGQVLPYVPPYLTYGWNQRPRIVMLPGSTYALHLWPQSANATFYDTMNKMNSAPDESSAQEYAKEAQMQIAENLPAITLFFYDTIWAHRTDTLVGWPSPESYLDFSLNILNATTLVNLHAPSGVAQTTSGTTSSTTPSGQVNTFAVAAAVVAILIVVSGIYALSKRKRERKN